MSVERAVVYDTSTGAIQRVVAAPVEALSLQPGPGEALLSAPAEESELTHYVDLALGVLVPRETLPYTLNTAIGEAHFTGLPQPCAIRALGVNYTVEDGEALLQFDAPGVYTIGLAAEPMYLATQIEVVVP